MADGKQPDPPQPAVHVTPDPEQPSDADRLGTVLMVVGIGLVVVILADLAFNGKLLAPLFALLPAPRSSTLAEEPDDGALPDTG